MLNLHHKRPPELSLPSRDATPDQKEASDQMYQAPAPNGTDWDEAWQQLGLKIHFFSFFFAKVYPSCLEAWWRHSHTRCRVYRRWSRSRGYLTGGETSEPLAVHLSFSGSAADAFITRGQMRSRCGSPRNSGKRTLSPMTCSPSSSSSLHMRHVPLSVKNSRSGQPVDRPRKKKRKKRKSQSRRSRLLLFIF